MSDKKFNQVELLTLVANFDSLKKIYFCSFKVKLKLENVQV